MNKPIKTPDWLVALLEEPSNNEKTQSVLGATTNFLAEGRRNNDLARYAGSLRRMFGLDEAGLAHSLNKCTVVRGKWADPYTGRTFTSARDVEVDHLVPLKWAWDRGAYSWSNEKRSEFANAPANLFVVSVDANQDKGAKGPLEWLPPAEGEFRREVQHRRRI